MTESYVYAITDGTAIKIGVARHPHKRLKALSTGNASNLRLLGFFSGGFALEKEIHHKFRKVRENGEWLHVTDDLVIYLNTLLVDRFIIVDNGVVKSHLKMNNSH